MLASEQYHVDRSDLERKKAYVQVDADHYTDAMTYTNVRVIDLFRSSPDRRRDCGARRGAGRSQGGGLQGRSNFTPRKISRDFNFPKKDMHTTSYWFTIPRDPGWWTLDFTPRK